MPAEQAIVAGTSSSAKLLRLDHLIGSLEPGKLADLVVIDDNPLDDMETVLKGVAVVMNDGIIVQNDLSSWTEVTHHRAAQAHTV